MLGVDRLGGGRESTSGEAQHSTVHKHTKHIHTYTHTLTRITPRHCPPAHTLHRIRIDSSPRLQAEEGHSKGVGRHRGQLGGRGRSTVVAHALPVHRQVIGSRPGIDSRHRTVQDTARWKGVAVGGGPVCSDLGVLVLITFRSGGGGDGCRSNRRSAFRNKQRGAQLPGATLLHTLR